MSRHLHDAAVPQLYQHISFSIDKTKPRKWLSFLTTLSLPKYRGWVRDLILVNFRVEGFDSMKELTEETVLSEFLQCITQLPQLKSLSLCCPVRSAQQVPTKAIAALSQLRSLEVLHLDDISFSDERAGSSQFSAMTALKELNLTSVRECEGSGKWSTFIPYALHRNIRSFKYYQKWEIAQRDGRYGFMEPLEAEPDLHFPEMRELRLPQPVTVRDVDGLIELLRRCPALVELGIEASAKSGPWGTLIPELGRRIPSNLVAQLQVIYGSTDLVALLAPGRPITKASIRSRRGVDTPLSSCLEALELSTKEVTHLAIWTNNWRDAWLEEITDPFPHLETLAMCVRTHPPLALNSWNTEDLAPLVRLQQLALVTRDAQRKPVPTESKLQRKTAKAFFEAIPTLQTAWLHFMSDEWKRDGTRSSESLDGRVWDLWGISGVW
ncbi:hypothetical protein FRB90_009457 [Tulasnella sp. 427]|nr:hypothetical protein FRB90_009457 [Tulasnella sp. 427]